MPKNRSLHRSCFVSCAIFGIGVALTSVSVRAQNAFVAYDEKELIKKLKILSGTPMSSLFNINEHASRELIDSLTNFISFKRGY